MAAQTNTSKKVGMAKYVKNVRSELKKVSWPNKEEIKSYTIVVLVTCFLAATGIWLLDSIFGQLLKLLVK